MTGGVTGGGTTTWSDRFDQGLHPAIERFNASIEFDINLLRRIWMGRSPTPGCWRTVV
jgi:argininosuccinate lyase